VDRSAAGFFVHAHGNQHDARALEVVVVAIEDVDLGPKRRAVAHVRCHRPGGLAGTVDQDDFARAAAGDGGHCARAAHIAGAYNSNLHCLTRCWRADLRGEDGSLPWNVGCLEQKPSAPLGLVDPVLIQAGAGHVVILVANCVGLAQARRQLLVVVAQLGKHIQ